MNRRAVTIEIKQRATARQEALRKELVEILRPDSLGLRTRINASFDEWTDRCKRSWMAMNITFCNRSGVMVKRLARLVAVSGEQGPGQQASESAGTVQGFPQSQAGSVDRASAASSAL